MPLIGSFGGGWAQISLCTILSTPKPILAVVLQSNSLHQSLPFLFQVKLILQTFAKGPDGMLVALT